jgi:hypothetical protein
MSYFRSYFDKNNTILKDSINNTAKNPNTEIFYGNGFSKYIFRIDLEPLTNKINNGDLVINDDTKHYLNLTNTIFGDETFLGKVNGKGRKRTSSFDLIVFPITVDWDEGVGFDYEKTYDYTTGNETFDIRPSNWKNRTTIDLWSQEGIYETTPTEILNIIHFDNGNENINVEITEYINGIISGSSINYGLGLAFHPDYSEISSDEEQSVAFFTKYTQTFFEPYLESTFEDIINDNRTNFTAEIDNNLYLYVTKSGNYYDLDSLPIVDIINEQGTIINGLENLTTTKVRKGVYKVTFGIVGTLCDGKRFFRDIWKNLFVDGVQIPNVTQKFIPYPLSNEFTIGSDTTEFDRYVIQYHGVKLNEKIKRGEIRKITVNLKSIGSVKPILSDDIYYRIYVKEGKTHVNVFDWTKMDKTNINSFILDTSFLIPREYYIEIKSKMNNEEIFYKDEIKFEIISEK